MFADLVSLIKRLEAEDQPLYYGCDAICRDPQYPPVDHLHSEWEVKIFTGEAKGRNMVIIPPYTMHPTDKNIAGVFFCSEKVLTFQYQQQLPRFRPENPEAGAVLSGLLSAGKENQSNAFFASHVRQAIYIYIRQLLTGEFCQVAGDSSLQMCEVVLDYIHNNYFRTDLSVGEIAAYIGVSVQYLNRRFRSWGGSSVRNELIRFRLKRAEELLRTGRYLVAEAAALTGWGSPFYFSSTFRKYYGFPPGRLCD